MDKKGLFLKALLVHNILFMDLLFFGCVLLLWKQGNNPISALKWAVAFYGAEGIVSATIKITKLINSTAKNNVSDKKSGESEDKK